MSGLDELEAEIEARVKRELEELLSELRKLKKEGVRG